MTKDETFMARAIELSRLAVAAGQTPFGAVIVKDGIIVAEGHNHVWKNCDPTAHGEITAIRLAAEKVQDISLAGCTIYSSCEPCPMCFAAIHWAGISRLVYGASIADADRAGFREMPVSNEKLKEMGNCTLELTAGVLREEAAEVLNLFAKNHSDRLY